MLHSLLAPVLAIPAMAAELVPNVPDDHTLHLWHLDEGKVPFADRGGSQQLLEGLLNGASAGHPSLPGLGTAVSFNANAGGKPGTPNLHGAILLARPQLSGGSQDNVSRGFHGE